MSQIDRFLPNINSDITYFEFLLTTFTKSKKIVGFYTSSYLTFNCYFLTTLSSFCCSLLVCPTSSLWSKIRLVCGWRLLYLYSEYQQNFLHSMNSPCVVGAELWLNISNMHFNHKIFLPCVFSDVQWGLTSVRSIFHTCYIYRASPLCVISDV